MKKYFIVILSILVGVNSCLFGMETSSSNNNAKKVTVECSNGNIDIDFDFLKKYSKTFSNMTDELENAHEFPVEHYSKEIVVLLFTMLQEFIDENRIKDRVLSLDSWIAIALCCDSLEIMHKNFVDALFSTITEKLEAVYSNAHNFSDLCAKPGVQLLLQHSNNPMLKKYLYEHVKKSEIFYESQCVSGSYSAIDIGGDGTYFVGIDSDGKKISKINKDTYERQESYVPPHTYIQLQCLASDANFLKDNTYVLLTGLTKKPAMFHVMTIVRPDMNVVFNVNIKSRNGCCVSPDGKKIMSIDGDQITINVVNGYEVKCEQHITLLDYSKAIWAGGVSNNGQTIAIITQENSNRRNKKDVKICWNTNTDKELEWDTIEDIDAFGAVSPDGTKVILIKGDKLVLKEKNKERVLSEVTNTKISMKFSAHGETLVVKDEKAIIVWDMNKYEQVYKTQEFVKPIHSVGVSADGNMVLAHAGTTACVWNLDVINKRYEKLSLNQILFLDFVAYHLKKQHSFFIQSNDRKAIEMWKSIASDVKNCFEHYKDRVKVTDSDIARSWYQNMYRVKDSVLNTYKNNATMIKRATKNIVSIVVGFSMGVALAGLPWLVYNKIFKK